MNSNAITRRSQFSIDCVHNRFHHMKSQHLTTIFLWLLACDLHRSCDGFVEESYLMGVKYNGCKDMSKLLHDAFGCKTCMIINAEVTVVSIEVIALFVAKFTIRSSRHGLKRIQMYCNQEAVCPFLQRLRALSPGSMIDNTPPTRIHEFTDLLEQLSATQATSEHRRIAELLEHFTLYDAASTNKELDHPPQSLDSSVTGRPSGNYLCLFQLPYLVTIDCRSCMRQSSGSKSMAEFSLVENDLLYIAHVVHSFTPLEDIMNDCSGCFLSKGEISGSHDFLCDRTHSENSARRKRSNNPDMMICIRIHSKPSLFYNSNDMSTCMKCLASGRGATGYWINIGASPSLPAYFLVSYMSVQNKMAGKKRLHECTNECPNYEVSQLHECDSNYYTQFEPSPSFEAQISTRTPYSTIKFIPDISPRTPYSTTKFSSDISTQFLLCVVAYYRKNSRCAKCLGYAITELSDYSSLIDYRSTSMSELERCISVTGDLNCDTLVFFPSEMCAYEEQRQRMLFYGNPKTRGKKTKSTSKPTKSDSYPYKIDTGSSRSTSDTENLPNYSGRVDVIVLVQYENPICLACYVILNEVLLISTLNGYVWMVKPKIEDWHCGCNSVFEKEFDYPKTHILRQPTLTISSNDRSYFNSGSVRTMGQKLLGLQETKAEENAEDQFR